MSQEATGPLKGLRLIEMGQLLAGPFCGQLMGDFGAEVIKIEQPTVGDPMRDWGREKINGKSLWWPILARNKKCITLNARVPEGQEIIKELAKKSDFLLENFRPGTLERWNLGYDVLSALNEALIMIRVSGYGQTGPYSHRAGYAAVGEAMGGLRYVIGDPSTPPSRAGISIGDTLAATYGCLGGLMALHNRHVTGKGQVVDSAIYEAVFAMMESLVSEFDKVGHIRERTGSILPQVSPSNIYSASDGDFLIAANQDTVFSRLCEAMGQPELFENERYSNHTARGENQTELDDIINAWTQTKTVKELEELMDKAGVPSGLIYRAPEMLEDAHFKAREAIIDVADKHIGSIKMQNTFPKFSRTPGNVRWTGPDHGEHNEEIYKDLLGMTDGQIGEYKEKGII
ncbi:MAG: CoA transferase [Rhodospirillaceae bacterium]|jgi:formyl-CoA transferase|nr:CoA transferase [Rhodospirillaceae bacterium]MBT5240729.1 CoA transferase [Rhodospirillaceae bacterium]MBT5564081.1 CoA transferase [Rhodospirillaceae bacterium]MBT6091029.1 CoA transferase [Rhodospirillaceae bacterium]MBT6960045.1 CoA transferase [Rhodospirillaceae bacterium]